MYVRVHHLNCGTLRPLGRRQVNGRGLPFLPARLVCHCLLVEAERRLVLVDTGFGLRDAAERRGRRRVRRSRLQRSRERYTRFVTRASLDPDESARRRVERLGFAAGDVTDIVLTHLDSDHAGGLRDFPHARVHVRQAELEAATTPRTGRERFRYWSHQWEHGPRWVIYPGGGDGWLGLEAVRELDGLPGVALVPLPGHTRGHAGVAVRLGTASERWLLHAGDTYFFHAEKDPAAPHAPRALEAFQGRFEEDAAARRGSRERLRALLAGHGARVEAFCSHDPLEFDRLSGGGRP